MSPLLSYLIRLGLSYGLHDREAFVEAFQKTFSDYFSDPDKAEESGKFIISQMETLRDELDLARLADLLTKDKPSSHRDLTASIEKLTTEISTLNALLTKQKI